MTLTADTSDISDADGLNNVSYSHQWIRNDGNNDADIAGETDSTYTPVAADVGKTIKVQVSFTDDAENAETLASQATAAVAATVPTQPLSLAVATGEQKEELDASWQAPSSNGGSAVTGYKVQWKETAGSWDTAADVSEATVTLTTYTITGLTGGVEYAVRVITTNVVGDGPASVEATGRPTGAPTISGTAQVGQTLTADTTGIYDDDGLANVSYSYQWIRSDNGTDTDIPGETDSTYTLVAADMGKTLKVRVSFTDDAENAESLTSGATEAVTRPPPSRAPEMGGISIHDGMLRISAASLPFSDSNPPSSVPAADVGEYIASLKVQWKSGSQEYDASRQAVVAPEPVTANVAFYAFMPAYDITGLTNDVEYTVRVIATNAGGDGPPSQEQTATPGTKSEELWKYIEDEIVEEHEASHQWLRQTLNYLRNNNIPLIVWTDASDPNTVETYSDDSSELDPGYVESLNFPVSIVDGPEATKKETILINLAYIYTMTNGVSSSPAPLGIAHVYFSESFLNLVSTNGACWESRLYLDVVVSLVLNDSLAGASDWNRCMARSEDATALAVVRSALSGQTPAWFADTYNDSEGNPDLDRLWSGVQIIGGGHERVVAYQLRNSFGGYCDSGPDWGLRISRSLSRALASAGFDTLVNPWRDGGCVPSAPISLTANLEGDGAASVSWEAPESNGGSLLSGYRIQWQSVDAEEGTTPQTKHVYFDDYSDEARPTEVSETIEGLTDGVEYTVRVLAHNPNGDGTAAEATVPEPNAAPTGVPEISGTPQVDQTLHVAAPDPEAYVTVVITSSDDTVSWSDPDECTSDYNTYLKVTSGPGSGTKTRTHIGSVASGSTEATQTITYRWTSDSSRPSGVELELYCGTFDASSRQNVLIASTYLATRYRALREGTYSSAPLTALSISSGTLSPAFDRGINGYTAEVPNDIEVITLDPTVLTGYQTDFVRNPIWGVVAVCGRGCGYGYGNGATTGIVLADADDETEGFQIDLNRGENRLGLGVNKGNMNAGPGRLYVLTVTVENSPATGQPTINGTAQVGQTLTVDTSGISDADGLDNVTYSYQWLSSRDTEIDGATSSTYTFQSSDNSKLIKVRVTFTDDAGYDESLTSEATVAVTATVPSAPQSLTVTSGSQIQELDASWQAPSSNGGSAVTGYKVQWKESTDSWDTAADVSEATEIGTTHTITSLTGGVEYAVRVIATNVAGNGPASTEARATPADSPALGEEGTETVESDSTAAWTATLTVGVSGSGSEAVWGYSWFRDGMGTLDKRTYNEGDQTIEVMAVLLSNGFVAFNVRPHPSVGFVLTVDGTEFASADASEVKSRALISYVWATTLDWAEDDRVALSLTLKDTDSAETPNAPTGLSVSALNEGMRLSWTAPEDSTVAGYQILRQRPYECEPTLMIHVADTGTTATTFIDPDLDRNVRYTYRVKAINGDKIGSWSNYATSLYFAPKHVTQPNTPAAPHSLDSVSTHGGIELTWEPPNSTDDIVGYRILRQRPEECEKSFRVHVENTGSTAATFVDEDVEVGTKYTYRVKAINAEGHGVWSGYTSTRRGLVEVIMMSSRDHHSITKGTKTQFQVSASHLPRDNDPSTVDYILRGDVTETEGGANVDSCEDANLGTDISISVVDSVSVQYGGTFGGPGCTAGNYTVTYVVTEADTGNRLAGTVFPYEVKSSLDVGSLLPNNLAKGLPTISGTPQAGQTLTANTTGIFDADGLDNVDYSYQWIGSNGNSDTDIEDATDSTYTPSSGDVGKTIKVKVSFTDDADNDETLTSEATVAVAATVPSAPQSLTVTSGSQDRELDASWQPPSSNGGSAVTGYKVQWKESTDRWDTAAEVSEATETGTTHTITGLTGGVEYAVRVIASNDVGDGPASTEVKGTPAGGVSEQTVEPENSAPTGLPSISGTPQVDQSLTASTSNIDDEDGLTNVSYRYQWIAGGSEISGATGSTHTLTASEQGKTIQVRVSFTDDRDNAETLTSIATAEVAAAPEPLTVRLKVAAPTSHDGSSEFTFEIQFSEEFGLSYKTLKLHAFNLTGGSVEKAQRTDKPSNIPWLITVKPQGTGDVTIELPATTGCNAEGAICTGDGRKLSNSLNFTISVPGQ